MPKSGIAAGIRRIVVFLESRVVSFWVIGLWVAMTLVWVLPFQISGQSPETIRAIAEDWLAFRVIYGLAGLTTLLCSWTRLVRDLRKVRRPGATHPAPSEGAVLLPDLSSGTLREWLGSHGYTVSEREGSLRAAKHSYSLLGSSVFHLGIVLFGISLVAHTLTVESVSLRVTEGQRIADAAAESDVAGIPREIGFLTLESIEPQYFKDVLLFTRLDATVTSADGASRRFTLSRPYWTGPTTLMRIGDYNLAPHVEVTFPDGTVQEHVVAMNLVPPGTEDEANTPDVPFEISIIAYPDHGVVDGRDVSLSYNIKEPAFLVSLRGSGRTGSLAARELVGFKDPISAGGYTVRITDLSRTGTFRITTAPLLPLVALALLTMTVGLAWRYLLRRQSVMVWASGDGVLIDAWTDIGGRDAGREHLVRKLQKAGLTG